MKSIASFVCSLGLIFILSLPVHAGYRSMSTAFSVQGILTILRAEYSVRECRNYDLKSVAEATYRQLKARKSGASYAPINCRTVVVEFINDGSNTLVVRIHSE
jgi:hypothetical protein